MSPFFSAKQQTRSKMTSTWWCFCRYCASHIAMGTSKNASFQHFSPLFTAWMEDHRKKQTVPQAGCLGCCRSVAQPHQPSGQRPSREQNAAACHRWQLLRDLRFPSRPLPPGGRLKIPRSALLLQPALPGCPCRPVALPAPALS